MERLLDIYNENNLPLGKVEFESVVYRHGLWHRTVLVVIHTPAGEVLEIKTSPKKTRNGLPDRFTQTCQLGLFSFVERGKKERETACKMLEQILQKTPDENELRPWLVKIIEENQDWEKKREFRYIYFFQTEKDNLPDNCGNFIPINQAKNLFQKYSKNLGENEDFWLDILNELSN